MGETADDRGAVRYDRRWAAYTAGSLALLRPLLPEAPGRLLDLGCGTAALAGALKAWGRTPARYVGVDRSAGMLAVARRRAPGTLVRAEASALPLADGAFDLVVSASSMHDWTEVDGALGEIRRVLAPGGRAVLLDWCGDALGIRLMRAWLAVTGRPVARVLGAGELSRRLRRAGFRPGPVRRARIGPVWTLMVVAAIVAP
jgi:ubiquinone/menaquinone biosynthesis C-methylase UbiE